VGTIAFTAVLVALHVQMRANAYRERQENTKQVVETAWSVIARLGDQVSQGKITREAAQKTALTTLGGMRYGTGGYFWINDMHPRMIMHPTNPKLNGTDLSNYRDPNGVALFVKMVEACRSSRAGFVSYKWPKPGEAKPVPKISYVKLYEPWGWIVGSGIYLDDVQAEMNAAVRTSALLVVPGVVLFAAFTLLTARAVGQPLNEIANGLSGASQHVYTAADDVLRTSQSIASGAEEQTAYVERTRESVKSLAEVISTSSHEAATAEKLMAEVGEAIEAGKGKMKLLASAMADITATTRQVSSIAETIDAIGFQTRILALNAAMEAARAGDAGASFGVVAEEVCRLADRASEAAQKSSEELAEAIRKSSDGSVVTSEVMTAFEGIAASIGVASRQAAQIASASAEKNRRVAGIQGAFDKMNGIARQNASGSQQTTQVATKLREQAAELNGLVQPLLNIVRGSDS
jgi:methyl-accepting chemotaxis protein